MKIRLFWFNLIVLKTTLEKANTSNGRIKTNNPILQGIYAWRGAGISPKLYGQTAFEKDRNSREIKTKRSTRTGTLNKTYIQKRPANQVIVLSV